MEQNDATNIRIEQKKQELVSKIIKGTESVDENGEFNYSNDDLLNLCTINHLLEKRS